MSSPNTSSTYVYFKLSKKAMANSDILDLTPGKLYKLQAHSDWTSKVILDDIDVVCVPGSLNLHLCGKAKWIYAHASTVFNTRLGHTKLTIQGMSVEGKEVTANG